MGFVAVSETVAGVGRLKRICKHAFSVETSHACFVFEVGHVEFGRKSRKIAVAFDVVNFEFQGRLAEFPRFRCGQSSENIDRVKN